MKSIQHDPPRESERYCSTTKNIYTFCVRNRYCLFPQSSPIPTWFDMPNTRFAEFAPNRIIHIFRERSNTLLILYFIFIRHCLYDIFMRFFYIYHINISTYIIFKLFNPTYQYKCTFQDNRAQFAIYDHKIFNTFCLIKSLHL
ncbi:unnamed protein product [Spodoptera exigua]|nr:unnamed protein product [Spodoptera exigua]